MADLSNGFEGGTSGTTITTGNSGGTSGDAFNTVSIGTGATLAFDNTVSAHGTQSMEIATGTNSTSVYGAWTEASPSVLYARAYIYATAAPAANTNIIRILSAGTIITSIRLNSTGKVAFLYSSGTLGGTSTNSFPLNQFFRLEAQFDIGAGNIAIRLYFGTNFDDTVITETISVTGVTTGGSTVDAIRFGCVANTASFGPIWMDDLGTSATTWLGPVGSSGSSFTQSPTDTQGLTDSVASVFTFGQTPTDDSFHTDSVATALARQFAITDDSFHTDSLTALDAKVFTTTDAAGMTDSVGLVGLYNQGPTDDSVKTDSITTIKTSPGATVAAVSNATGGGTSVTVPVPTGTALGDLLVAVYFQDNDGSFASMTAPAGWTQVYDSSGVATTAGLGKVFTKTATASEGSTYVFPGNAGAVNAVEVLRITGWNPAIPFAAGAVFSYVGVASTTSLVAPSVTLAGNGLLISGYTLTNTGVGSTITPAAGMTGTSWESASNYLTSLVAYKSQTIGASGTQTATASVPGGTVGLGYLTVSMGIEGIPLSAAVLDDAGRVDTLGMTHAFVSTLTDTDGLTDSITTVKSSGTVFTVTPLDDTFRTDSLAFGNPVLVLTDSLFTSDSVDVSLLYFFKTPTWHERMWGNRLFDRMHLDVGHSILKFGNSYQRVDNPSTDQIESADAAYLGGRTYLVTKAEAQDLTNAGYGQFVVGGVNVPIPDISIDAYGAGIYGTGPYGD